MTKMYTVLATRNRGSEEYELRVSVKAESFEDAVSQVKERQPGMDSYKVVLVADAPRVAELL